MDPSSGDYFNRFLPEKYTKPLEDFRHPEERKMRAEVIKAYVEDRDRLKAVRIIENWKSPNPPSLLNYPITEAMYPNMKAKRNIFHEGVSHYRDHLAERIRLTKQPLMSFIFGLGIPLMIFMGSRSQSAVQDKQRNLPDRKHL